MAKVIIEYAKPKPPKGKYKLEPELIPAPCFYISGQNLLPKEDWDKLRKLVYERAKFRCQICGKKSFEQGKKYAVECHEVYEYNEDTKVQKLVKMQSLCYLCHSAKHFCRPKDSTEKYMVLQHFMLINKITEKEAKEIRLEHVLKHKERSKMDWTIDFTILKGYVSDSAKLIYQSNDKSK